MSTQAQCDRARRLAQVHTIEVVAELLGISESTIRRMKRRGWVAALPNGQAPRPMPTDFAIQSRHMTTPELRRHYRASAVAIARWMRQLEHPRPPMLRGKSRASWTGARP